MRLLWRIFACIVGLSAVAATKDAQENRLQDALSLSRTAIGQQLPDVSFTNTGGKTVRLTQFGNRPMLVTLVYTSCLDVCPTLVENLYPAVKQAQLLFGSDSFSVVTIGFDVRSDTPQRMKVFARRHGALLANWHFLSGDEESVNALAKAVGFGIYSRGGGFDHAAQISVVDKSGRVNQQIYGAVFEPPMIIEPLKDLIYGRFRSVASIESVIDRIKLFCTVYDPNSGRYYFNYSIFIGLAIGGLSLGLVGFALAREWRRSRMQSGEPT